MVNASDLHGIHVALLTPVRDDGRPDQDALTRLVRRVLDGGVRGVCPVGSTGEGPRLTRRRRREVTEAVRAAAPDAPVIAAPSALTSADALDEIAELATAGADAVLLAPPSYYPMAQPEIVDYYLRVADDAVLPVVVYNIPAMTKVAVPPPVLGTLAGHANVIGLKDSSRDLEYLQAAVYTTQGADFAVLTGTDTILVASLTVGAAGAIAASANLVPALSRQIFDDYRSGDVAGALRSQRRLFDIVQACRAGTIPAGWKAALSLEEVCQPAMVPPARALGDDQLGTLAGRLRDLGVLGQSGSRRS